MSSSGKAIPVTTPIHIVGSRFDPDTHRLREFASRNRLLHDWVDADETRAASLFRDLGIREAHGPIVLVKGGTWLHNPSNAELANAVGLGEGRVPPEKTYDLVVIGGGPAGLAAGVYGASSGLRTAIVEADAVGGQAATSARIENYLGFSAGLSGADLAERARLQATKFGAHIMMPRRAVGLTEHDGYHVVTFDADGELLAGSVLRTSAAANSRRLMQAR
jgi:thioredoxin reductase (NADPH)